MLHPFRRPILCHRIIKIYRSSDVNFRHPICEKKQLIEPANFTLPSLLSNHTKWIFATVKINFCQRGFCFFLGSICHMKPSFVTSLIRRVLHFSDSAWLLSILNLSLLEECSLLWKVHLIVCGTNKSCFTNVRRTILLPYELEFKIFLHQRKLHFQTQSQTTFANKMTDRQILKLLERKHTLDNFFFSEQRT